MNIIMCFGKCGCGNNFSLDDVGKVCPDCGNVIIDMSAQLRRAVDDGDSLPSQAVSKPDFLSTLLAIFQPTHHH